MKKKMGILGLIFNLLGAISIAISLEIIYIDRVLITGYPTSFAYIKPFFFYGGLIILFLGFLLQLIEKIKE